jgi:hypothetical protein
VPEVTCSRIRVLALRPGGSTSWELVFERFADGSRSVLVLAQEEARTLAHGFVGTEHVLLGLLRVDRGIAARVLRENGVTLDAARSDVAAIVGSTSRGGPPQPPSPPSPLSPPFTPRAKKVLELAVREALQSGDDHVEPEHLLLGLIGEGGGVACQVLVRLGVSPQELRPRVVELVSQDARRGRRPDRSPQKDEMPPRAAPWSGPGPVRGDLPVGTLLAIYRGVLVALVRRPSVRTDDPPVQDYAELLLAEALGGELVATSTGRCDVRVDDRRVRVRPKLVDALGDHGSYQLAPASRNFHSLAVVLLDRDDLTVVRAVVVPVEALGQEPRRHPDGLVVTTTVLDAGHDVTTAVQAVEQPLPPPLQR